MTFAKILIMSIIVGAFLFTLYKFILALRDFIKAKKQKNNACSDEISKSTENNIKEVNSLDDCCCINGTNHHNSI